MRYKSFQKTSIVVSDWISLANKQTRLNTLRKKLKSTVCAPKIFNDVRYSVDTTHMLLLVLSALFGKTNIITAQNLILGTIRIFEHVFNPTDEVFYLVRTCAPYMLELISMHAFELFV